MAGLVKHSSSLPAQKQRKISSNYWNVKTTWDERENAQKRGSYEKTGKHNKNKGTEKLEKRGDGLSGPLNVKND